MSTPQQQSPDPVSSERGEDELDAKLEEQFSNFMEQVEEWQSNIAGMPSERDMMLLDEIYAARIAATKQLLVPSSTSPVARDIDVPTKPVEDENEPIVEMISPYPFVYEVKPEDIERPTHKHWVCVRGKYMVDYDHLIQSAVAQAEHDAEMRGQIEALRAVRDSDVHLNHGTIELIGYMLQDLNKQKNRLKSPTVQ